MQKDFHYYACYCAAVFAGYEHEDALKIAYSNQFVDDCTQTLIQKLKGPQAAATTQSQAELMEARTDIIGLQNITRIWASFHFLPYDLNADVRKSPLVYRHKYRLICNSNGDLLVETIKLAHNKGLQAAGISMHILSDTWAHKYFAGTPSLVINNTNYYFYEMLDDGREEKIIFRHSVKSPDDLVNCKYTNSVYQGSEINIMNLGHGRAGHFPDYSFAKYRYMPAWGGYKVIEKDNPADYMKAFAQMVYALKFLRGEKDDFEKNQYDFDAFSEYRDRIEGIIRKRQLIACDDWKTLGEELSGEEIPDFDVTLYQQEYLNAPKENRDKTFLGRFFLASMAQKSMVTNRIFRSGNLLAGFSTDGSRKKFKSIKDFKALGDYFKEGIK